MTKPSLPQGTRDFGPDIVRKRNYILSTIKSVFETYGFQPLETPAMENLETLMGKYGDEGDKLIFKILNNGLENPNKETQLREGFEKILKGKAVSSVTERALKYDLTIPFARYVAMNHTQLTFPFKRYQMQPVWRADRPQRGRYREFYQCDADVVGSQSLLNEIELVNIYATVFKKLGVAVDIKINNRKILTALSQKCGNADNITAITVAIDKLDKIGMDKVKEELQQKGLSGDAIETIGHYLSIAGTNEEKLAQAKEMLGTIAEGQKGIEEIEYLINNHTISNAANSLIIDFTLARGLNYYTGCIFEIKALEATMGSIGGGGRYDNLTGLFGVPNIPGVGISFGIDRIYDVIEELQLFPDNVYVGTQVLFFNLGEKESLYALKLLQQLREQGIRAELFHENTKFDKQFKYAEKKNIPFVVIIGEEEMNDNSCKIKNRATGEQQTLSAQELLRQSFK